MLAKAVAHFETILVDAIDKDSTTMTLDSISTPAGNLAAGTYGFVIEQESNSKREYVMGTLSGSTFTFTKRDVSPLDASTVDSSADDQRKSHRKGSSIKLSNFPILTQLQRILSGDDELDADTPIVLDASRTPATNNELVTKEYVDSVVNGGTIYFETQILRGDAGEVVAAGQFVYLDETDGEWYLVDTDDTDWKNKKRGIAQGAGTDGNAISGGVLVSGLDASTSYTPGQVYYGSNTAGSLGTSAGTNELVAGVGDANNKLVFFGDPYQVTDDEKDAMVGSQGNPDSANKFLTEDHSTAIANLQTQTTSTNTIEVGEADTTLKKNVLAQSFTATKTKLRGVRLYKKADTGSFSGTVKIALQADSSGAPSGSDLASVTISNANWLLITSSAEFMAIFSSEYTSLTVGATYWIVIDPSTSDDANHPNLGGRTSGGNGELYYQNTTDGWTQLANTDLYYKTIEGVTSQIVETGSDGKIPSKLVSHAPTAVGTTTQDLSSTTTKSIAHGLGEKPSYVELNIVEATANGGSPRSNGVSISRVGFDGTNHISHALMFFGSSDETAEGYVSSSNFRIYAPATSAKYLQGTITFDDTNIYITWSTSGTPTGTVDITWEAYK